jgi:hypothetical protein
MLQQSLRSTQAKMSPELRPQCPQNYPY